MLECIDSTTLSTFFIFLIISYLLWDQMSQKNVNIPGPRPWPVVGNLLIFFKSKNIGETYRQLQRKYGDLVNLKMGQGNLVVVFGYKNIREVLVDNSDKTKFRPLVKAIFPDGNGVGTSNGQEWQNLRKFTITALKDFGVGKKSIEQRIQEEIGFLLDFLAKKNTLDVSNIYSKVTSNIVSNIIFGSRFDYDDVEFNRLIDRISMIFKLQAMSSLTRAIPFLRYILPSSQPRQLKSCRDDIQGYIQSRINQQRESFDPNNIRSFIDLYLEQESKSDSKISEASLLYTIADLYFAGTDTTSLSLQWCMLYMLKYPEVQKKCREEILEVIGDDRLPVAKDRVDLPYVMATLHEVQRIATIAPNAVPHRAIEDVTIDGMTISKDSTIVCSLLSVHRDPSLWDDPDSFDPKRFLDNDGKFCKVEGFIPFSQGPRICLGRQLAETELLMFFVSILQRFNLKPANDNDEFDTNGIQTGATYQPKPFKIRFVQR